MTPDLVTAATKAAETLLSYHVTTGPVAPIPILTALPHVIVVSYAEMAHDTGIDRENLLHSFSAENYDAMTLAKEIHGVVKYFVVYNQRLPAYLIQRSLARELGHIVLGHDGTRPEAVRMAEAQTFAYHFLCPRALVKAIQESGIRFTTEILGNMTGCFERCLAGMRKTPGICIPAELNRRVRDQFAEYIGEFLSYQAIVAPSDESALADFGTYMEGYEE